MSKKITVLIALLTVPAGSYAETRSFSFETTDGVTVYGEVYRADHVPMSAPLVLLFHQGASNGRAEYEPIAPTLLEHGYNAISIDQRRGGERFGGTNRTLAGVGATEFSYCEVYPDLEGTLEFAAEYGFTGGIAAWGSSYSAALILKLGVDHPDDIDAVLAFSPASGEPMEGCMPHQFSEQITQPLLALRPIGEMDVPYVPGQMRMFEEHGHQTYVADPGVHGSSMLNEARVEASTADTWKVVLDFLANSFDDRT